MVIFEAFFIFFTCIIVFAHVFKQGIKQLLQEYVPPSLLRQLFGNQNIDEDIRAITEAGDHMDQPLTPPSSSRRSGGSEFEVFLSFRGEDTRKGFTGHLYDGLQDRGVSTFIDNDKLEKGEEIDKLLEYMKKSEICVLIISKHYAESKWCLKELTTSVECHMKIIPVFFGVEPSDVRNQSGLFKSAFKKHQSNKMVKQEEVRKWREALTKVGNISGFNLKDMNGDEVKLKHVVMETVIAIVNKKPLEVAKHPIGIKTRVLEVKKILENGGKGVDVVGIHGMGGLGKTTIAMAVYNELAKGFDGKTCFLSNVRETARQTNGLVTLQKQVFQDILNDGNICLSNVAHGASLIKERVSEKRALLVIDDVDSVEQLDALAGGRDWFGSGSVIIITTRDEEVLLAYNVKGDKIYKPQELNKAQSRELFMLHAFNGEPPQQEEYVELSNEVVGAAGGLPLTLKVVGSLLSSKRKVKEWKDTLEKLKKIPSNEVQQRLRISYDSLDEMEKKIFLDISCFFLRRRQEYATYMWEGCGWFPNTAIRVLVQRSLIKIQEEEFVGLVFDMHDQVRDMGRAIVKEECSRMFQRKSRLMIPSQDSLDLLSTKVQMTVEAEGIEIMRSHEMGINEKYCVSANCFEKNMPNLRYLYSSSVNFQGTFPGFPPNLRWLELRYCKFDSMPSDFNMEKLVILELHRTNIAHFFINQIRLKGKAFEKLKVLSITSVYTNFTLDFTNIPSLEKLSLECCSALTTIDESIGNLKNLMELSIGYNMNLENVPESIGKLTSLKKLFVLSCGRLSMLPNSICQLSSLEELDLSECRRLCCLPEQIGHMESLKKLTLSSTRIEVLPDSVCQLKLLECLDVGYCTNFYSLPEHIGHMKSLKKLKLFETRIEVLPDSVCQLKLLECLHVTYCRKFCSLPEHIGHIESLKELKLSGTSIEVLPDSVCQLKLLECLDVGYCTNFYSLPERVGEMEKLRELILDFSGIKSIPDSVERLKNLCLLSLNGCNDLEVSTNSITNLFERICDICKIEIDLVCSHSLLLGLSDRSLKALRNMHLKDATIEVLPDCVGRMEKLKKLLIECEMLKALPDSIGSLQQLWWLTFKCKNLKALPHNITSLQQLRSLTLECENLKALPHSITSLQQLEKLTLKCENLKALPDSIASLQQLEKLTLECENLKALPNSIGSLQQLEWLTLKCENLKALPDSITSLQRLKGLTLECKNLKALPDNIGFEKLMWLTLKCENVEVLFDIIMSFKQLHYLTLECENLKALPDNIGSFEKLDSLTLKCKNLEVLPDSIGLLKMMCYLQLKCTNLKALPDCIGELKNIERLKIESAKSKALPDSIALAHLSHLESLDLRGCHRLQYLPPLPSSLLSLDAFGCTELTTMPDLSGLKALEKLNLGGCQLLEDLSGFEHISHNLQALALPGPCDFIGWSDISHDFMINKVLKKKEVTFESLRRFEMSGSLATRGSTTGKQRLHFMLPRLPFIWLRRAWLTLSLDKVVPPIHVGIMADETILFEKIVEVIKDNEVELNLRKESFLNIVEGEQEHCYTMQVIVDVSQLQNVSVLLEQNRGWLPNY